MIEQICLIEEECFSSSWSFEQFVKALKSESYLILATLHENTVTAYLVIQCIPSVKNLKGGEMEIINIATKSKHRRKGYAQALLSYALAFAKENKVELFFLDVKESNFSARNLYKKLGFNEEGRRKNYYLYNDSKEDALLMAYRLK